MAEGASREVVVLEPHPMMLLAKAANPGSDDPASAGLSTEVKEQLKAALKQLLGRMDMPRAVLTSEESGEALRHLCELCSPELQVLTPLDFEPKERIIALGFLGLQGFSEAKAARHSEDGEGLDLGP